MFGGNLAPLGGRVEITGDSLYLQWVSFRF